MCQHITNMTQSLITGKKTYWCNSSILHYEFLRCVVICYSFYLFISIYYFFLYFLLLFTLPSCYLAYILARGRFDFNQSMNNLLFRILCDQCFRHCVFSHSPIQIVYYEIKHYKIGYFWLKCVFFSVLRVVLCCEIDKTLVIHT